MDSLKFKTELYKYVTKTKNIFSPDFLEYLVNDPIVLYYSDFSKNWGDYINPFLVERISGKKTVSFKRIYNIKNKKKLTGVGSILHHPGLADGVIWGSGFIHPVGTLKELPSEILVLRGKHSAKIFQDNGVKDRGAYGDPALLFPTFYKPNSTKKFKIGFLPHYSELNSFLTNKNITENKDVTVISPMVPQNEVYKIIDQIDECEIIVSSSLHGLILADVYQIPSLRFTYTNKIFGGDFKYDDYYSGVGINQHETLHFDNLDQINYSQIYDKASLKDLKFSAEAIEQPLKEYISRNYKV